MHLDVDGPKAVASQMNGVAREARRERGENHIWGVSPLGVHDCEACRGRTGTGLVLALYEAEDVRRKHTHQITETRFNYPFSESRSVCGL